MRAAIAGIGMVTSVGNDAASSCAAIRAGLVRPGPLPHLVLDREDLSCDPVTGYPVPLASGFEGVAAHALLTRYALRDLARTAGLSALSPADWQHTALTVCVSPSRAGAAEPWDAELAAALPAVLASATGLPIPAARISLLTAGHAGVLLAAKTGMAALEARAIARAIVVGVDSLVGEDEVEWLADDDRLKTPEHPVGLIPGQAAAALLLEPAWTRRGPGPRPLALLADVFAEPLTPLREDSPESDGKAVARVITAARAGAPGPLQLYGDCNGETWRAREWGTALVHLQRAGAADLDVVLPATTLGDTGAASGAIAVALAARAFVRGYARAPRPLVCSRSERGHVAAARLEPAPARP